MNLPIHARRAAELLSKTDSAALPVARNPEVDEAIVAAMEAALAARSRRKRAKRAWGLAALAAILPMGFAVTTLIHGPGHSEPPKAPVELVVVAVAGVSADGRPFHDRRNLDEGSRITTSADSNAAIELSTGTRVGLEHSTILQVESARAVQQFHLEKGSIRAHVAHLAPDERFIVRTRDATVEVRGTVFSVTVDASMRCPAGVTTRVHVEEGAVLVRARDERRSLDESRILTAGSEWPSNCEVSATTANDAVDARHAPAQDSLSDVPPPDTRAHQGQGAAEHRSSSIVVASDLAEQNDAFARAVRLRRNGDESGAAQAFGTFLGRYPRSPLRESAMIERMRTLRTFDVPKARDAAQSYLEEFPNGPGSADARRILADH